MTAAVRFAAAYAVLTAAHEVGDYWVNAAKGVSTFRDVSLGGAARACSASKTRNTRVSSEPQVKVHSCG